MPIEETWVARQLGHCSLSAGSSGKGMALLISCWVGSAICWLSDTLLGIIRPPSFWVRVGWVRLFAENSKGYVNDPQSDL